MTSRTITFVDGNESWEVEASGHWERPDRDSGYPIGYFMLEKVEFWNLNAVWYGAGTSSKLVRKEGRWQPFAMTEAQWVEIEEMMNEEY